MRGLCLSFDYARMADTSTRLLTRFNQGEIARVDVTSINNADPFAAPSNLNFPVMVNGVSKGVSEKYVDGANILMSDIELTLAPISASVGGFVSIDGVKFTIVAVYQIPPSGVTVVTKLIVRGGSVDGPQSPTEIPDLP